MKIVVISDTHLPRFRARLDEARRRVANETPDLILHCGDLTELEAIEAFKGIATVEAVVGNNDGADIVERYGRRKIVDAGGLRIGMIHGDGTRGTTLGRARAAFATETVDAIVFGHSHVPYSEKHGNVWVVNPGSITDKRRQPRFSYAVLESDGQKMFAPRIVFFEAISRVTRNPTGDSS